MRKTTEREKQKLYRSAEYKKMLEEKGDDSRAWNWQAREAQINKEKERLSKSHHVAAAIQTGGTNTGLELENSFESRGSHGNRAEPMEVQLLKMDHESSSEKEGDFTLQK